MKTSDKHHKEQLEDLNQQPSGWKATVASTPCWNLFWNTDRDHVSCPEICDYVCFNKEGFGFKPRAWGSPGSIPRLQDTACHLRTLLNRLLLYFLFPLLWPSLQVRNYGWSVFILLFIGPLKPSAGEPFSHSTIVYTRHPLFSTWSNGRSLRSYRKEERQSWSEASGDEETYKHVYCLWSWEMSNVSLEDGRTNDADPAAESVVSVASRVSQRHDWTDFLQTHFDPGRLPDPTG